MSLIFYSFLCGCTDTPIMKMYVYHVPSREGGPCKLFLSYKQQLVAEYLNSFIHFYSDQRALNYCVYHRMENTVIWSLLFVVTIHGENINSALLLLVNVLCVIYKFVG